MASIFPNHNGYSMRWNFPPGRAWHVRLRGADLADAEEAAEHVDALIRAKQSRRPIPYATSRWLQNCPRNIVNSLARCGLYDARRSLADAVDSFLDDAGGDISPGRLHDLERELQTFVDCIGSRVSVSDVGKMDVDRWLRSRHVSNATLDKYAAIVRKFFRWALAEQLVEKDPTDHWVLRSYAAESGRLVTKAEFEAVLNVVSQGERLALRLIRWLGLRASEAVALRWEDVDLVNKTVKVRDTKRNRERLVPVDKSAMAALSDAKRFMGHDGFVLGYGSVYGPYTRNQLANRIMRATSLAGVPLWPRLFHNLRATRQTEWIEQFGIINACHWVGNSATIAQKHYAKSAEESIRQATDSETEHDG